MTNNRKRSLEEYTKEWWKIHRPLILQETLIEFREAYLGRAETGELAAYIKAILHLAGVLMYLEEPLGLSDDDPAYQWWCDLAQHLEDLSIGIVPPVLKFPIGMKGLSTVEWLAREKVVDAIELLHATGITYDAAALQVIRGYKLDGVSEKEALSWRREFKKGKVKNREAMELYKDEMAWLEKASAEEIQRDAARLFKEKAFVSEALSRETWARQLQAALKITPRPPKGK